MNVKLDFCNEIIEEEVYVSQPLGFEDHENRDFFSNLNEPFMVSNKLLDLGMNASGDFCLQKDIIMVNYILLCF